MRITFSFQMRLFYQGWPLILACGFKYSRLRKGQAQPYLMLYAKKLARSPLYRSQQGVPIRHPRTLCFLYTRRSVANMMPLSCDCRPQLRIESQTEQTGPPVDAEEADDAVGETYI